MFNNKFTSFIYALVFVLLLLQVYISSGRATDGDKMAEIETKIQEITMENESIQTKIYTLTSIANIQKYSQDHQMVPAVVANLGSVTVASLIK